MLNILRKAIILISFIPLYIILSVLSRLKIFIKKLFHIKPAVVWGVTPIINIIPNSESIKKLGYKSKTVVYHAYYITNEFDYNFEKYFKNRITAIFAPFVVFLWSLLKFEVFNFYFDGGFLKDTFARKAELPLLRFAGKKIVIFAYGGDVRYKSLTDKLGKYNCCIDCPTSLRNCICDEEKALKSTRHASKWANATCSMGDMTEYTPGSINNLFYWPIDIDKWKYSGKKEDSKTIKIIHAPNHPHYKGTKYLEETVKELKEEGYDIELVLLQNIPNELAKKYYADADIIAEQFIVGWHGYFAIEAMALGKPVICYIRKKEYLPEGYNCPIVSASPDNLKEELIKLIKDPELRLRIGKEGRAFVEKVYSLEKFGERLVNLYKNIW